MFISFEAFLIIEIYASYMMALAGVELQTLVFEPDALITWPVKFHLTLIKKNCQNEVHRKSRVFIEEAELWLADVTLIGYLPITARLLL